MGQGPGSADRIRNARPNGETEFGQPAGDTFEHGGFAAKQMLDPFDIEDEIAIGRGIGKYGDDR